MAQVFVMQMTTAMLDPLLIIVNHRNGNEAGGETQVFITYILLRVGQLWSLCWSIFNAYDKLLSKDFF